MPRPFTYSAITVPKLNGPIVISTWLFCFLFKPPWPQKNLAFSACRVALEQLLEREVDLINLRLVSTVFQNEILDSGRLIIVNDAEAVREFEMRIFSFYQKLSEERKEILADFYHRKRAYAV